MQSGGTAERQLNIAFISPEYVTESSYSGGLANYLGRITQALVQKGHTVHVFVRSDHNGETELNGVQVHRVVGLWDFKMRIDKVDRLVPRALYQPYQDLKAAYSLWLRWRAVSRTLEGGFDVTQVANVLAVGLFFRWTNALVVTRLSSYRPLWDCSAGGGKQLADKVRWWMEKVAIRGVRHCYSPTHFVARLTEEHYKVRDIQVIESPFFIEQSKVDESLYAAEAAGRQYLLFFGRMTQMKGVHVLVEALPKIWERCPEIEVFFIGRDGVAPDGGEMTDYIRKRLSAHLERIHILQSVRHDALYPFIDNARMVVLPSLLDNLPNTCLEAMGHGKVVVATTGTCFEQIIVDGESGYLAMPDDAASLADVITKVWRKTDAELAQVGAAAQRSIARLHPDKSVAVLVDYYRKLIDAHRA